MEISIEANGRSTNISQSTMASVKYSSRMVVNTMGLPRIRNSPKRADTSIQMAPFIRECGSMANVKVLELLPIERETSMRANGKTTNMINMV